MLLMLLTSTFAVRDAHIRLDRCVVQQVSMRRDAAVRLTDYMRLPVEQYCNIPLPMQATLERTAVHDEFALRVPPIRFAVPGLPITVSPFVLATVTSEPDCVLIASDACTLTGSPIIEATRLNERFDFRVRTKFTWVDGDEAEIRSSTNIEVDVDTPRIFALVPRPLLEAIAAGAMRIVLDALQATFLRNLASDYERWATDAAYRASRVDPDVASSRSPASSVW